MFAGAAREVVFSNPDVVRRVNEEFIPVALKAAMVNNPPQGIEGQLYAEIGRSKPAPQGICSANSAGKVLTWALSFDDDKSILGFLDQVAERYRRFPDAQKPVPAERFMKFPSRQLADVADTGKQVAVPQRHAGEDRCPAAPALERGTLVGRIIGRALDRDGKPVADTIRQEHYMEARLEVPARLQEELARAASQADGKRFRIPNEFAAALVGEAYLGQLDVHPLGNVPGSQNDSRKWEFWGQPVPSSEADVVRIQIEGESSVAGGQDADAARSDGRMWEHSVSLKWEGFADIQELRVNQLLMVANGTERLRWGNARFQLLAESDAEHLMAGHPIDLECTVRYGLVAEPCSPDEVGEHAATSGPQAGPSQTLRAKMEHLQAGLRRLQQFGGDPSEIARLMKDFGPLVREQKFQEAEALLDEAIGLLEKSGERE